MLPFDWHIDIWFLPSPKVNFQGHAHFYSKYLADDDRWSKHCYYQQIENRTIMFLQFAYLYLTSAHCKCKRQGYAHLNSEYFANCDRWGKYYYSRHIESRIIFVWPFHSHSTGAPASMLTCANLSTLGGDLLASVDICRYPSVCFSSARILKCCLDNCKASF